MTDTLGQMSRALVIFVALSAAVSILLGGITVAWWSYQGENWSVSMGLRQTLFCSAETCQAAPSGGQDNDAQWVRTGAATYAASILSFGLLMAVAVMLLLRRRHELLIKTSAIACVGAAVSGLLFAILSPDYDGMSAGYSLYTFFVGSALGVTAGVLALRVPARVISQDDGDDDDSDSQDSDDDRQDSDDNDNGRP